MDKSWDIMAGGIKTTGENEQIEKAKRVRKYIVNNPGAKIEGIAAKFGLRWNISKSFKNGLKRVNYFVDHYSDDTIVASVTVAM